LRDTPSGTRGLLGPRITIIALNDAVSDGCGLQSRRSDLAVRVLDDHLNLAIVQLQSEEAIA
jgi:hypothetical protein